MCSFFPKQINSAKFINDHINFSEFMKADIVGLETGKLKLDEDESEDKTVYKTPKRPEGTLFYYQDFEKADDNDGWIVNGSGMDVVWQKKGCDDSRGCLKFSCTSSDKGYVSAEKYFDMSVWCHSDVEFDYFVSGCCEQVYFSAGSYVGSGMKPEKSVRYNVKDLVKGKWTHVKIKWDDLIKEDKYAELWKGPVDEWNRSKKYPDMRTYGSITLGISGIEKECKDTYLLIDNFFIREIEDTKK
jgi:hypothetical protein